MPSKDVALQRNPTRREIRRECRAIQQTWTPAERRRRRACPTEHWFPQLVEDLTVRGRPDVRDDDL